MANLSRHSTDADLSSCLPLAQPGAERETAGLGRYVAGDAKAWDAYQRTPAKLFLKGIGVTVGLFFLRSVCSHNFAESEILRFVLEFVSDFIFERMSSISPDLSAYYSHRD